MTDPGTDKAKQETKEEAKKDTPQAEVLRIHAEARARADAAEVNVPTAKRE